MKNLIKAVKLSEGFRDKVYKCTEGYDTIGYGFAIKDLIMDEDIAETILERKLTSLIKRIHAKFPFVEDLPGEAQEVVYEMCYQLGLAGFSKFKKTIYYLETEQYAEASTEMLDSLWYKQTPNRAKELSGIIASLAN